MGESVPEGDQGAREMNVRRDFILPSRVRDSEFSRLWEEGIICKVKTPGSREAQRDSQEAIPLMFGSYCPGRRGEVQPGDAGF